LEVVDDLKRLIIFKVSFTRIYHRTVDNSKDVWDTLYSKDRHRNRCKMTTQKAVQ